MKKSEVMKLLTIASAFDSRRITDEHVAAWFEVIGDLEYPVSAEAVRRHFRTSERWLLPVHVTDGVAVILSERTWDGPVLSAEENALCAAAGVPPEEFVERRDDHGWVAHLRSRWLGIES